MLSEPMRSALDRHFAAMDKISKRYRPFRDSMSEIASRIAFAKHSNDNEYAVPGLEESGVLPPSEWSPTTARPEARGSNIDHLLDENGVFWVDGMDKYKTLADILDAAFNHAAVGKGKERHARDLPFDKQPMLETTRLVGPGFPLGQAIKKAGEAAGMIERGQYDAAEAECLGAINYLAGAVAWVREQKAAPPVAAPTSVGAAA